jgi:hypothetical protein
MLYEKQNSIEEPDNNALPKEDTDKFSAKAEIPQENTAEGTDERTVVSKTADEPDSMNNEINDHDMTESTEIYIAAVTGYNPDGIIADYIEDYYNDDNDNDDGVVLDPDNFEYFKGVSSNSSETNFVNR